MKVLVLGGCGIQGRGALFDLSKNDRVSEVVCADVNPRALKEFTYVSDTKVTGVKLDANDRNALLELMGRGFDVVLDTLPPQFVRPVTEAAIRAKVNLLNTNYAYDILDLHQEAVKAGISIMPECGLDPGIDLVLYGYGMRQFDELHVINSYCGGIPERKACDNPLNYKISWSWDAVLKTQKRDSKFIRKGSVVDVPGQNQHENEFIHQIQFPGLGNLEALPNGNAVRFTDLLGVTRSIVETGRYSLRWPGWCDFWRPLKRLGFLSDDPIPGLPNAISPRQFLVKLLEPQLQYKDNEKDLAVMQNVFIGIQDGKRKKVVFNLLIERDLQTGLMGMSLGVSYPLCIVGEMIARGEIGTKGILSPVKDIPVDAFFDRLRQRGILFEEIVEQ